MDFRIDQTIAVPVTRIQELLGDEAFVTATSELAPLADCRLLAAETSGTRRRLRIARRFAAALPSVVTAVVDPDRLTWVEEVDADLAAGRADHRIVPDHYTDLLRASFTTVLRPEGTAGDATRRLVQGTVRVRVLLGAGRVERAIVSGLEEYAVREADLLATWERP